MNNGQAVGAPASSAPSSKQSGIAFATLTLPLLANKEEDVTPEQTNLVQASFAHVVPIADKAADLFYSKLFAIDPSLRGLFSDDMTDQKKKLMAMLATAVNALHRWETVSPAVKDLGRRHVGYGAKPEDYGNVGLALIGTLEAGLGDAFTAPVREAWIACYTTIAGEMLQAAEPTETVKA